MPRTGYKPNAKAFDIVKRIIERVNLQLATVTRPGINRSNAEGTTEDIENPGLQRVDDYAVTRHSAEKAR